MIANNCYFPHKFKKKLCKAIEKYLITIFHFPKTTCFDNQIEKK